MTTYSIYFTASREITMEDLHKFDDICPLGFVEVTNDQPYFVCHSIPTKKDLIHVLYKLRNFFPCDLSEGFAVSEDTLTGSFCHCKTLFSEAPLAFENLTHELVKEIRGY